MAQLESNPHVVIDVAPARRTAKRILGLARELTAELAKLDEAIEHEAELTAHLKRAGEYGFKTEVQ